MCVGLFPRPEEILEDMHFREITKSEWEVGALLLTSLDFIENFIFLLAVYVMVKE